MDANNIGDHLKNIEKNIELNTTDPVLRGGFTQVPNFILEDPNISIGAKVTYSMFLKYAWDKRGKLQALEALHNKIANLSFFDPACGCGNFLIIAYRELRRLEIDILRETIASGQLALDVAHLSRIDVDQFFGIEIGEFPAEIARASLWMMDHIMNNELSLAFGQSYARIPLKSSPHIHCGDALMIDWKDVIEPKACSYILGNPPFVGHQWRTKAQQAGMHHVWGQEGKVNRLDYVTCWYKKAVEYSQANNNIRIAFVSTSSICQGEQASIMWPPLFSLGTLIFFAHRTFAWGSEARGKAAVHCIIVGLTFVPPEKCRIYDYASVNSEPVMSTVPNINRYLVSGPSIDIPSRGKPANGFPKMFKGSQPTDGARIKNPEGGYITRSNLILREEDKQQLLSEAPEAAKWLRLFIGGDELISGENRWCLWLKDAVPAEVKSCSALKPRLDRVREGRLLSSTKSVREYAKYPTLFTQDRQPDVAYLALPRVSSERREYIPMTFFEPDVIAHEKLLIIPAAPLWLFSLLTSIMHMGWMRTIAGRLKSDYSYSPTVYNSFPWPELNEKAKQALTNSAKSILDARDQYPNSTFADLYDPDYMPPKLRTAHRENDRVVDRLYRGKRFDNERERVEHLFMLYEQMTAPLMANKPKRSSRVASGKPKE